MRMRGILEVQEARARAVAGTNRLQRTSEYYMTFSPDAAQLLRSNEREDESQGIASWVAVATVGHGGRSDGQEQKIALK